MANSKPRALESLKPGVFVELIFRFIVSGNFFPERSSISDNR